MKKQEGRKSIESNSSALGFCSARELDYKKQRDKTGFERLPVFNYAPASSYFLDNRDSYNNLNNIDDSVDYKSDDELHAPREDFMRTL